MTERDRFRTLNGKYSSVCGSCLRIVYNLWVSDEPPPAGCCEGHDDAIWKCGTVYNALVAMVIGIDHFNRAPDDRQEALLKMLGEKRVAEMFAHIRSGKEPPSYRPREPSYERAQIQ
jgi:hypothetical protein